MDNFVFKPKPIKFRAWDKKHKFFSETSETQTDYDNLEILEYNQSTNWKDSAGKDIYEGDIVEGWVYTYDTLLLVWKMRKGFLKV